MTEAQWIKKLEEEGYKNVATCSNPPNADFGEHTHDEHTVHIILHGELLLIDGEGIQVLRSGDRFEILPGTTHTAKCGTEGCNFVVGVKKK